MIDYTRILEKIVPQPDGEATTRLRSAVVVTDNGNGTANITLSGVTVPSVPILNGVTLTPGAVVQVLVYQGALLILGAGGAAPNVPTAWPNMQADFGAPTLAHNAVVDLVPGSVPFDANPMWPGSGGTFTVPVGQGGLYDYGAHLRFPVQASPAGIRQIRVVVNGVERSIFQIGADATYAGASAPVGGSSRAVLAAGSTIIFRGHQTSGVSTTLIGTGNVGWIQRVG